MHFQWKTLPFALFKKLFYYQFQFHRIFLNFKEQIILMILNFPAHNRKKGILTNFFIKPVNTKFDKVSTIKL